MNMDMLYGWMKEALAHFGLRFCDMDKVTVTIQGGEIKFSYEHMAVSYQIIQ